MVAIQPTRSEKKKAKGSWFELNRAVMEDPAYVKLKPLEVKTIHALLLHFNVEKWKAWPSLKTLARYVFSYYKEGDPAPSDLCRTLNSLEAKGFITRVSGSRTRSNHYIVQAPNQVPALGAVSGTGSRRRAGTGSTRRAGTGSRSRSNSHTTAKLNSHSNSRRKEERGVSPSEGVKKKVSKRKQRIIKTFLGFGARRPLIRATLKENGCDLMEKIIDLIHQKDECGKLDSVDGFAVWALQHPDEVTFDASGSEASKKKRKKKPRTRLSRHDDDPSYWRHSQGLCEKCGKEPAVDGSWCQPCIDEAVAAAEVHYGSNRNGQTASSGSRRF